jgi:hypothetical protein
MPGTARMRGLATKFAELLRCLNREFRNLGFAAAAHDAGPGRFATGWVAGVRFLAKRRPMCAS